MDHSVIYVRQLARLLWLVLNDPANVDEQKGALRILLSASRQGPVNVALHGLDLRANDQAVPMTLMGVADLTVQMARHGLSLVRSEESATPAELLGVVRILASTPALDDGGAAESQRVAAGITGIRFATRPADASATPTASPLPASVALGAMDFGDVLDAPLAPDNVGTRPHPVEVAAPLPLRGDEEVSATVPEPVPSRSHDELLALLESTIDADEFALVLEELVMVGESAAREGQARVVCEILHRVGLREAALADADQKQAAAAAWKRLGQPVVLRLVARELPRDVAHRDENLAILARAKEVGADALVDQITSAAQQRDRRVYFEALRSIDTGAAALLHMLGDERWFVVRRAVDLLGEMQVEEAEAPLSTLLEHGDERIRRAVTGALMSLGTPRALVAIKQALADPAPATRMQAAAALAVRQDAPASEPQLLRALDVEKDDEVQAAFLSALGKLGTPQAVQRLISASEQKRGMFHRKTTNVRVAAVIGLAEACSDAAVSALRALHDDKDDDVRTAVAMALGRIASAMP